MHTSEGAGNTTPPKLLNVAQAAQLLGVGERKFHMMREQGLVPLPLNLGGRTLRWPADELLAHIKRAAPRGGEAMPAQLRRARIEAAKSGDCCAFDSPESAGAPRG